MSKRQFDVQDLSIIVGTHIVSGYSPNAVITLTRDAPLWITTVDANGKSTRRKNNNRNASLTVNLSQASPSNDVFSTYFNLDEQFSTGTFAIIIKDNNGSMLVTSAECYVEESAKGDIDTLGENERVWNIKMLDTGWFIGGLE